MTDDPRQIEAFADTQPFYGRPEIEIIETETHYSVLCEIPWALRQDIRIDASPHRLVIAVLPLTPGERIVRNIPGVYIDFERVFPLPTEILTETVVATFQNGVLEIRADKKVPGGSGVYRLPAM